MYVDDTIILPAVRQPAPRQPADSHAPPLASVNERPVKEEAPAWPRVSNGGSFV